MDHDFDKEVKVRRWKASDIPRIVECQNAAYPHIARESLADERKFGMQLAAFPEGQLLAEYKGQVIGYAVSLIVFLDDDSPWYSYDEITDNYSTGPTWEHPMGTDGVGHDVLAMVLRGAQKSVQIMLLVALFSTTFGVTVGAVAGYYRGWVDATLMRLVDLVLTIPSLAVLLVLVGIPLVVTPIVLFAGDTNEAEPDHPQNIDQRAVAAAASECSMAGRARCAPSWTSPATCACRARRCSRSAARRRAARSASAARSSDAARLATDAVRSSRVRSARRASVSVARAARAASAARSRSAVAAVRSSSVRSGCR